MLLGLCSIIASTPCLRDSVMRRLNGIAKGSGKGNMVTQKKAKKVAVVVDKGVEMVQKGEMFNTPHTLFIQYAQPIIKAPNTRCKMPVAQTLLKAKLVKLFDGDRLCLLFHHR